MRFALVALFAATAFSCVQAETPAADFGGASWIWADAEGDGFALADAPGAADPFLWRWFEWEGAAADGMAVLSVTADDAAEVWLNGKLLGRVGEWTKPLVRDVTAELRKGSNVLAVHGWNPDLLCDAGGMVAALRFGGRRERDILSGSDWRASLLPPEGWPEPSAQAGSGTVNLVAAGGSPWLAGAPGLAGRWPDMPKFLVGSDDEKLAPLRDLLNRHYLPGITCTLWDPWMPRSMLWVGFPDSHEDEDLRRFYAGSFLARRIMPEGYVEMRQHRGLGFPEGWPFPLWTQGPGVGWHFSVAGIPYGAPNGILRTTSTDGWLFDGAAFSGFDASRGLELALAKADASVTTPIFRAEQSMTPAVRLEWRADGLPPTAQPHLEWTTEKQPEFSPDRRLYFTPAQADEGLVFTLLRIGQVPGWEGPITRFRISFDNPPGAKVALAGLFTATDSRKPITNPDFILGSTDFFGWTGDLNFLRAQINRLRLAMAFILREFGVEKNGIAYVAWPGHEGRSGVTWKDGKKILRPGNGIGNNYFDLLPFGAWDAYLNVRVHAALRAMSKLEAAIAAHPQWNMPNSPLRRSPEELTSVADKLRTNFQEKFWSEKTQRFVGAIDADGVPHDYGFVPVNLEAIVYGLASKEQARAIFSWLDGERIVEGDTSTGEDIYKWRFGPRMSTVRNIDYYLWAWSAPESIPFGDQIQDGGGVLGFSYYDLMARLDVLGPDNALARLNGILDWYREVQAGGGYRKYYETRDGTLQGGGPPGGLGLDQEFFESMMVPSVVIYGFLGLDARPDGLHANPRLPEAWPTLTATNISYRDWLFNITAERDARVLKVRVVKGDPSTLSIQLPEGWTLQLVP